jgi:hypothetical protein
LPDVVWNIQNRHSNNCCRKHENVFNEFWSGFENDLGSLGENGYGKYECRYAPKKEKEKNTNVDG